MTERSFADPGLSHFGDYYYIYATGPGFPVRRATAPEGPYSKVTKRGFSMNSIPKWVGRNPKGRYALWAPSVFEAEDAEGPLYVMYFSGFSARQERKCVGVATSRSPDGGFLATGRPICSSQRNRQAVDPSPFSTVDGSRWMVFKTSFANRRNFRIQAVNMGALGITPNLSTKQTLISSADKKMEGPSMISHDGRVFLFLARGRWRDCTYSTDVWSARSFSGRFTRVRTLMSSASTGLCGPGGATVLSDGDVTRIAFHAYLDLRDHVRPAWVGELTWNAGVPFLL